MIADAATTAAPAQQPDAAGAPPADAGAVLQALFLPFLQQAAAPPGSGEPKAPGARTAQSEGADKNPDTDSAGPVAPPAVDPLAAALLQVSLPVPVSGAPTHTDDAQEQGAGAHGDRTAPLGPARPLADALAAVPQLSQDATVDAARPSADPANWAAAQTHAAAQIGGTAAAGAPELGSASVRGLTDPAAALIKAAAKQAGHHRPGALTAASAVGAVRAALHDAARGVSEAAPLGGALDATSAPATSTSTGAGQTATPTAHSRLGDLPGTAATLLQVATAAKATRARIVLTPPELGKVEIRLRYGSDGVTATFHADSSEAAQSLAGAAGDLRRSLEAQGIQVARLDVPGTAASTSDQQGSQWLSGGSPNPGFSQSRGGHGTPAGASTLSFDPDDDPTQTTLRTVLLGTAVDVLA